MGKPKPFLPSSGELKLARNFPLALTNLPKTPHSVPDSEIIVLALNRLERESTERLWWKEDGPYSYMSRVLWNIY